MGTYTVKRRPGIFSQLLKTVRPISGGWVNKMGFRNPGIESVVFKPGKLYSIVGLEQTDWDIFYKKLAPDTWLEVNLGCPNHSFAMISDGQLMRYLHKFKLISFKLGPTDLSYPLMDHLISYGANTLHLCNTIPTEKGGESGKRLKKYALAMIEKTRQNYPHINIIGGGGIYNLTDLQDYKNAGANHFSLSTIWATPWKAIKILKEYENVI